MVAEAARACLSGLFWGWLCLDAGRSREIPSALMRVRPSLFVLAALAVATATGCGSSSIPRRPPRARGRHGDHRGPTPDGKPIDLAGVGARSSVAVKAGQVDVSLRLRQPADTDPPIAKTAQLTLPRGHRVEGRDTRVLRRGDARARPRRLPARLDHRHGRGHRPGGHEQDGRARSRRQRRQGRRLPRDDRPPPGYVKTIVPGKISRPTTACELDLTFPADLQTIAGVPVGLQQLRLTIKRGPSLVVPDCPDNGWAYDARVGFDDGTQVEHVGKAGCSS